jgi:hypothetical protein
MTYLIIFALCVASAVLGRLLLTRDQAWRTIRVRIPSLFLLIIVVVIATFFWILWGIVCFIGGSFYGLSQWWWPQLFQVLEFNGELLTPIITGRWE